MKWLVCMLIAVIMPGAVHAAALVGGKCDARPVLKAAVVLAKDIGFSGKLVQEGADVPEPVASKIHEISKHLFDHFNQVAAQMSEGVADTCDLPLKEYYGQINLISDFGGLDIYIFQSYAPMGYENLYVVPYDPKSHQLAGKVFRIFSKWHDIKYDPTIRGTLVSWQDLDGDGIKELRILEVLHNGTMYNALAHHYFSVENGKLVRPLVFEFYSLTPTGGIHRGIMKRSPAKLSVAVKYDDAEGVGFDLVREDAMRPYHLAPGTKNADATFCEGGADDFFANSCRMSQY